MVRRPAAVLDACVLYPAPIRDLLLELAEADLYRPHWTDAIQDEWVRALLESRPELGPRLPRTCALMNEAFPDARVLGYEHLLAGIHLPDPDDRHVVAAGMQVEASVIITTNLDDFPRAALVPYRLRAVHPDHFISGFMRGHAAAVAGAARTILARLRQPRMHRHEYLQNLASLQLTKTAELLEGLLGV